MYARSTLSITRGDTSGSLLQATPATPMISLIDAMQPGFDHTLLDLETDSNLYRLMAKAEHVIAGWDCYGQPMVIGEQAWYNDLHKLVDTIKKTLNTRYGCND
ncbi:hypothetical protein GK091_09455 [Spirosoma agri]|uniref:Uncharacterized protein n=1 Tax=Spirosoma agri TaxID=1987381 RepID=A0A6M0IJF9_9BACT|nr:hypothetical protein [Spirosoma agri]NEU67103.1 hypothetical protein [Spirosoma agri]